MKITSIKDKETLLISLAGELDHHAAKASILRIGQMIDYELPTRAVLDLSGLMFMDSSGIAVIINIYRRIRELDASFEVINVPKQAFKVLAAAGLERMIPIKAKEVVEI